jgi:hypothetical protein
MAQFCVEESVSFCQFGTILSFVESVVLLIVFCSLTDLRDFSVDISSNLVIFIPLHQVL